MVFVHGKEEAVTGGKTHGLEAWKVLQAVQVLHGPFQRRRRLFQETPDKDPRKVEIHLHQGIGDPAAEFFVVDLPVRESVFLVLQQHDAGHDEKGCDSSFLLIQAPAGGCQEIRKDFFRGLELSLQIQAFGGSTGLPQGTVAGFDGLSADVIDPLQLPGIAEKGTRPAVIQHKLARYAPMEALEIVPGQFQAVFPAAEEKAFESLDSGGMGLGMIAQIASAIHYERKNGRNVNTLFFSLQNDTTHLTS